jgi:ATP-dependent 26S proteasome regulatory subunit
VLWHGAPGTGKTSAVRALVHAWRGWADTVVVTDPEALLTEGRYLRRLVLDADDDDERWTTFVLEDAEALLRKETGGAAMGRLLNLTDGLLGQGLRCLFVITTNEPLGAIHPAIVRPGRCLAQVEFGPLSTAQAAGLLGRPVDRPMTLAEVMSAGPVRTAADPVAVGQYL